MLGFGSKILTVLNGGSNKDHCAEFINQFSHSRVKPTEHTTGKEERTQPRAASVRLFDAAIQPVGPCYARTLAERWL